MGTSRKSYLIEKISRGTPLGGILIMSIEDPVIDSGLYGQR